MEIADRNKFAATPEIRFKPVSLHNFTNFVQGLKNLYDSRIISRTTYGDAFGYNFEEELNVLAEENDMMKESGIEEFAPAPFSPQPKVPGQEPSPTTEKKPSDKKKSEGDNKQ